MIEDEEYQKLLKRALHLISIRPRSIHDIKKRLSTPPRGQTVPLRLVDGVIEKLIKLKLVDDRAFCVWLIESRKRTNRKGHDSIKFELLGQGIAVDLVTEVLSQELSGDDEYRMARNLLEKKTKLYTSLPQKEKKTKLLGHLLRRGFSPSLAYRVIDEMLGKDVQ